MSLRLIMMRVNGCICGWLTAYGSSPARPADSTKRNRQTLSVVQMCWLIELFLKFRKVSMSSTGNLHNPTDSLSNNANIMKPWQPWKHYTTHEHMQFAEHQQISLEITGNCTNEETEKNNSQTYLTSQGWHYHDRRGLYHCPSTNFLMRFWIKQSHKTLYMALHETALCFGSPLQYISEITAGKNLRKVNTVKDVSKWIRRIPIRPQVEW